MAETGIVSAVGLCLESIFRKVPLTSDAIGIATTNPHRFFVVEPGGGIASNPEIVAPDDEIDGDVERRRTILTGKMYEGGFAFKCDPENLYYPLLGIFGRDVQTTEEAATTGQPVAVYKHVFTPNKFAPSFTCEEKLGVGNVSRVSSGYLIRQLEIDFGDIVTARMNGYAYRQIPNTYPNASGVLTQYTCLTTAGDLPGQMQPTVADGSILDYTKDIKVTASPVFVDVDQGNSGNGPLVFAGMKYGSEAGHSAHFLTINGSGVVVDILPGATINLQRAIDVRKVGGSWFDPGATAGGAWSCDGRFDVLFKDMTLPAEALNFSKISLNFAIEGITIATSSKKYLMEVHLPNCKFQDTGPEVNADAMVVGGTLVPRKDPALGYSCKITLINTVTNAALGGGAGTTGAAGGLGGWNNA